MVAVVTALMVAQTQWAGRSWREAAAALVLYAGLWWLELGPWLVPVREDSPPTPVSE